MAELGVTQDQFLEACTKASQNPLHKKIVDQITAVDNFIAFKKLMVKRNTELNEMALKMSMGQHLSQALHAGAPQAAQTASKQPAPATNTGGKPRPVVTREMIEAEQREEEELMR